MAATGRASLISACLPENQINPKTIRMIAAITPRTYFNIDCLNFNHPPSFNAVISFQHPRDSLRVDSVLFFEDSL